MGTLRILVVACMLAGAASFPAGAETLICIPEEAAAVRQQGDTFTGAPLETGSKFIVTNEGGSWIVKHHPSQAVLFANCTTEYFCDAGEMFSGALFRTPAEPGPEGRSTFTVFWLSADNSSSYANVAKGYCTLL